ncbi:MAG: tRNA (adenosine(37)-N6)-threonylcarbamoyltransferase complex ATPase subunit type 1 TsaE [Candidatus Buchananbacteria bacterium]|nr:tRNA (adenosine(37)-N6)-threonylcarbamoyltransferase complex ATPase subunit type 1 TsaE [Candidatus Buchananbacteria bacterium]
MIKKIFTTKSEHQTHTLGIKLAKTLQGGDVLALTGNLGAGKTVLTKGIAKGLGITSIVNSPTFILMRVYPIKNKTIKQLVHIDCYRLQSEEQLREIGATEYFNRPDTVTVIEWAEKIKQHLPKQIIKITVELLHEDQRKITITTHG